MQTVHVLGRRDALDDRRFVNLVGQWQLYQDAVESVVRVETGNQVHQIGLPRVGGQLEGLRVHSNLGAGASLVANVDCRRRVISNQHRRQAGLRPAGRQQARHAFGYFSAQVGSDFVAIQYTGGHGQTQKLLQVENVLTHGKRESDQHITAVQRFRVFQRFRFRLTLPVNVGTAILRVN